ncbi:putative RNA-binding protein sce3 [Smittium mucronatum]|uniref:Putative RNA-binding protein sce3 n=1 Tax=Smittium mucronatum TaxID=133383 RepID=A0A1R0GSX9_9FUNG|nr:putative RNA-binding protein sce3 [Smittium mucronatum]
MPPKKKSNKAQKMNLNAFLMTSDISSSWADDEVELPSAPTRTNLHNAPNRSDLPQRDSDQNDYRHTREEVPFPTEPPYNAYVENLPYDVSEADITLAFSGIDIQSTHIFIDFATGRSKGTAILTFPGPEQLTNALNLTGTDVKGRNMRVNIAKKRAAQNDDRDFSNWRGERARDKSQERTSAADENSQWRKHDDPAPRSGNSRRFDSNDNNRRSFEPSAADTTDKWRQHRDPQPLETGKSFSRETSFSSREPRPLTEADKQSQWRNNNSAPRAISPRPVREPRPLTEADKQSQWRNNNPTPRAISPRPDREPRPLTEADKQSQWRNNNPAPRSRSPKPDREPRPLTDADKKSQWRNNNPLPPNEPTPKPIDDSEDLKVPTDADKNSEWRKHNDPAEVEPIVPSTPISKTNEDNTVRNKKISWDDQGGEWRRRDDSSNQPQPRSTSRDGRNHADSTRRSYPRRSNDQSSTHSDRPNQNRYHNERHNRNRDSNDGERYGERGHSNGGARYNEIGSSNDREVKPDFKKSVNFAPRDSTTILKKPTENVELVNKFALLETDGTAPVESAEQESNNNDDDGGWTDFVPKTKAKNRGNQQKKKF